MRKCESWAVAAVYLMDCTGGVEHYRKITRHICATNLTTLGEKGRSASQTVGTMLRTKKVDGKDVFVLKGNGYYSLSDKDRIKDHDDIRYVFQRLDESKTKIGDDELMEQNKKLREENRRLCEKLKAIKKLCKNTD